jgi:nucleotide-binding universal stress UspA family protein
MSYKNLLVHVDPSEAGRERVRAAVKLAQLFDARVIGVAARSSEVLPDPIGLSIVHLKQAIEEDFARSEAIFKQEVGKTPTVWRTAMDFPTEAMLLNASGADLIIAAHGVSAQPMETQAGTADLIMRAGTPILMMPAGAKLDLKSIIIGWKNVREARRAVSDALPLLKRAEKVHVLTFRSEVGATEKEDLIERLRRHQVKVQGLVADDPSGSLADGIQAAAQSTKSGLIVVGGYGHSRMREWVLGGVTQELLRECRTAVLFSH